MLELLQAGNWQAFEPEFRRLQGWEFYPLLLETLAQLDHSVLFVSKMHGLGHIERTILQGGFCAMEEGLDRPDTELLLLACSYHDVGRQNDWVDDLHGHRSAQRIGAITGRTGEDLKLLQGAVDAHSRREPALRPTVEGYAPADPDRAILLAQLLKERRRPGPGAHRGSGPVLPAEGVQPEAGRPGPGGVPALSADHRHGPGALFHPGAGPVFPQPQK